MKYSFLYKFRSALIFLFCVVCSFHAIAQTDEELPPLPNPPRLVNDLAGVMSGEETQQLEDKLVVFDKTTSTQISIVTLQSTGAYEPAEYGTALFRKWKIGQKGKNNGVLVLAAIKDRKAYIITGYGLEGALTDAVCGRIVREEMAPRFKQGKYFEGFSAASDKIIAATKGEYTADENDSRGDKKGIGAGAIVIIVILIYFVVWMSGRGGGGGGGNYMSGRGYRRWGGGWGGIGGIGGFGGFGGGGWGGGDSGGGGGGGFGGFGGGSTGGGGAGGSW